MVALLYRCVIIRCRLRAGYLLSDTGRGAHTMQQRMDRRLLYGIAAAVVVVILIVILVT